MYICCVLNLLTIKSFTTMAVIRNSANTVMRGRVGQTTYYFSNGQQIARQAKNNSNYGETARRSDAQQLRRVMWANLVNFYKVSAGWMPKAFETKKRNQTDYNKFMQLNIGSARMAFTKDEAAAGACIADGFIISQGSLPSIQLSMTLSGYVTDLALGSLAIDGTTTVGDFSQALINNNVTMREGMQLSFASYVQSVDSLGIPRVTCRLYEVTLNANSTEILRNYLPEVASTVISGYLGVPTSVQKGAFAYIASELVGGALKVSTQQLVTNPTAQYIYYSQQQQIDKAIASYGLDQEVILNPNYSIEQGPAPAEVYISAATYNDGGETKTVLPGEYFGTWQTAGDNDITFRIVGIGEATAVAALMYYSGSTPLTASSVSETADGVVARWSVSSSVQDRIVTSFVILLSTGQYLEMECATTPGE